jgi:formate dehydrogenase maturation protein FdhE
MYHSVDLANSLVLCFIVASLMIVAGVGKHALEEKERRRPCPSCGRNPSDCLCR